MEHFDSVEKIDSVHANELIFDSDDKMDVCTLTVIMNCKVRQIFMVCIFVL